MTTSVDLDYPFTGKWLVQNSPANRVPSHGTTLFGTSYAIDFVPVDDHGRTAPVTLRTLIQPERPERFPGFGFPVLAPVDGVVEAVYDGVPDHKTYRGFPSLIYALSQRRRMRGGWLALAGNSVFITTGNAIVALCHLQQGSALVRQGQRVRAGEIIGRCGNSGNSTEPHLHVQALSGADFATATAVPISFRGSLPRNGEILALA
ncbi:M23 family metallopeptidase [Lysinibacter cavernae]|uniref:M23ase beta-sheet core domain-containing protein n=1 Tax=Lysinibacter cavernae TaxID=1640652 RepID=A0A7X5QYW5_9MICO|nr:M23 family metallopeptidase [Lysinibacter cavernae]NIH52400.1 hypothetical protein [Lysinibacter cavernae]